MRLPTSGFHHLRKGCTLGAFHQLDEHRLLAAFAFGFGWRLNADGLQPCDGDGKAGRARSAFAVWADQTFIAKAGLGLENGHAAADIRDLRGLIDAWREARRTAWQTTIKVLTTGVLAALLVGVAIKLRLMGGPQ